MVTGQLPSTDVFTSEGFENAYEKYGGSKSARFIFTMT